MVTTLCVFGCVLAAAQTPDRPVPPVPAQPAQAAQGGGLLLPTPARHAPVGDEVRVVRLDPAQELVYRGTFTETEAAGGVQCERVYRVEARAFVLDAGGRSSEVALLTVLKPRSASGRGPTPGPASVRLEVVRVDSQGRIEVPEGVSLLTPLEGPPTLECGEFVPLPATRVGESQPWQAYEDGRPARTWEIVGAEPVNGHNCLKVVGAQQSPDWEQPRGDRAAWKRQDTVWLSMKSGFAYRVERVIEHRAAGHTQPAQTSTLRYQLDSSLPYTRQIYADCREEIQEARSAGEALQPLLTKPDKNKTQLELLAGRLKKHVESATPTPYRDAVLQVQKQVEAALRGELPPPIVTAGFNEPEPEGAAVGSQAPDFTAPCFTSSRPEHLLGWRGRPVLMVFYQPDSFTAPEVLAFAQSVRAEVRDAVTVLGMAMTGDAQAVLKQRDALQLTFPLLDGSGLRRTYGLTATPKFVVLDADGVVRGSCTGWGQETPKTVKDELRRWLSQPAPKR